MSIDLRKDELAPYTYDGNADDRRFANVPVNSDTEAYVNPCWNLDAIYKLCRCEKLG